MPKINVNFKGKNYSIDKSLLAGAIADLEATLSGMSGGSTPTEERLEGDGAEYYTLAPTALSFRSTAPLNELQEIQINGVTVDPSNYTLEEGSTIVTFPIEYLKTLDVGSYEVAVASDSKTVKGGFNVKAPELNEHGFYYNQPYVANVPYFGGNTVFFLREGGTMDTMVIDNDYTEVCSYTADGNSVTVTAAAGVFTGTFAADGNSMYCNELQTNFVLGDESIAADEDYIYIYDSSLGGYSVTAIDKTQASYGPIRTGINGKPTLKIADYAFVNSAASTGNTNIVTAPEIPNTVTTIGQAAFSHCTALNSIFIPDSVTTIDHNAFNSCNDLTNVSFGERSHLTYIQTYAFYGCKSLMSITIPSSVNYIASESFAGCSNLTHISFNGTMEQWNAITTDDYWNRNVPATYVQCSDGQVAL